MIKGKINIKISKTVLFSIVLFLSMVLSIHAENISQSDSSITDSLYSSDQADTTVVINENAPSALSSSTISISDSSDVIKLAVPPSGSGPDTVIVYSAKRRMVFNVKSKIMYLNGDSKLKFSQQNLEADNIQILFDESLIKATATKDADGKGIGYPEFTDKGETFYGETILYNFKTKQGTIKMGETKMSEGFYYGDKIKMLSKSELFIKDGCYTTCDAPHPHYYFGSPKMKVVAKDKVFIDPIIFYVEDMPIFILPVGLFFPNKTGRQSGIMIPSFNFSHNRGISFEDFGFYWAASDYYDTQIRGNYYSKGGYVFKNNHRWKLRDVHSGSLDIEYGETRFSPDDEFKTTYKINLKHNHTFSPQTRINAAVNYMGGNHLRNTSHSYRDILKQNVSSNAGFSHSFDDWGSISLSMNADQNISTKELSMSFPNLSYSLPTWKPLKSVKSLPKWMQNVSLRYSGRGEHNYRKQLEDASLDSVNFRHT
ncbi:MAG: LPS-assembly protein LptD, partial [Chlorobi bacterium]|nr:LPS-assembly protein LptD [Chlorobiota bacterium]